MHQSIFRAFTRMLVAAALSIGFISGAAAQQKIEVELVTIRDGGFYPPKITRPAGPFILIVKNRSHANSVSLGITGLLGLVIAAVESVADLDHEYSLSLTASTYTLADSAHPGWTPLTIELR